MASFPIFDIITVTPAAAVAKNATVAFTYPTTSPARAAASYRSASGAKLNAKGLQKVFTQGASNFSLSYGASSVTLTNLGETSYPAGKELTIQIPLIDYDDLTDSTTGTAAAALAAGAGVQTVALPIQLAAMTTAAADLITNYTPGYKFKILSVDFVTTKLGTGAGATQTLNLEIGTTDVTGGVVNPTLASTDTLGEITAGTAVTANNTGTASDTISVEVASGGTVFTAGDGILLIKLQNMDTADAFASIAAKLAKLNALERAFDTMPE